MYAAGEICRHADWPGQALIGLTGEREQRIRWPVVTDAAIQRSCEKPGSPATRAGGQRPQGCIQATDDATATTHDRARFTAIWKQLAHEIDIERLAHRNRRRAAEIRNLQPGIGAGECRSIRLVEIQTAGRTAVDAKTGYERFDD